MSDEADPERRTGQGRSGSDQEDRDETFDSFLAEIARLSSPAEHVAPSHAAGDVVASRYVLTRPLGRGAHGVVWACLLYTSDAADE